MKKKLYSLWLLLALALTGSAQEAQWCLVVESTGGETIAIGADLKPVITTTAEGYQLSYGGQVATFAWSQLKKLTVEQTVADANATLISEVSISGAQPGTQAQVYSADGRRQLALPVAADGSVQLSTTGLPAGLYIVKTQKSTFKILKK